MESKGSGGLRYLLTQSLLGSWLYIYNAYEDYEDEAFKEFKKTLNREISLPTQAMQAGIDFENMVNAAADGAAVVPADVKNIADIVRGGQKQVKLYQNKEICGIDFLMYGILDYLKAGVIYDIKFSKRYEVGKYLQSIQHPFYFELCPEADMFEYLISNGNDVFAERYHRSMTQSIDGTVREFLKFLRASGLLDTYFEKWAARN